MNSSALEPDEIVLSPTGRALSRRTSKPLVRAHETLLGATCFALASGLPQRSHHPGHVCVLDTSLGIGARMVATLRLWRSGGHAQANHLYYVALAAHPLSASDMAVVLTEAGFEVGDYQTLLAHWPHLYAGVHRIRLPDNINVTLYFGGSRSAMRELNTRFETIFLTDSDGVEPDNDNMRAGVSTRLAWLAGPACRLVSDLPFTRVRRTLGPALPEHPTNVQTDGATNPMWSASLSAYAGNTSRAPVSKAIGLSLSTTQTVAIIGAGIAGLACAHRLHEAGFRVSIIEAGASALLGGSAQPVLAGHVHYSPDDNPLAKLTRTAQAHLAGLPGARACPRWQMPVDRQQADSFAKLAAQTRLPRALLRPARQQESGELTGLALSAAGLWQAESQILFPEVLRDAVLPRIECRFNTAVGSMRRREDGRWQLADTKANAILAADKVLICTARLPHWLTATRDIALLALAGQSQRIGGPRAGALQSVIGSGVYACPLGDGTVVTGSTWRELSELPDSAISYPINEADCATNLSGWRELSQAEDPASPLPGADQVLSSHAGVRFATRDRLPLIGAVPDRRLVAHDASAWIRNDRLALPILEGVYAAAGFGSRGALWSALAATLITDTLVGAPAALETSLADAIAPQRFLRQRLRRNQLF